MGRRRTLPGSLLLLALLATASPASGSRVAATPPACAPISVSAPSLRVLAERARAALGAADQVASGRVARPPRRFWGDSSGPRNLTITAHSPWIYVRVQPLVVGDRTPDRTRERAGWQASLLIQALHVADCAAGRRAEAGDSIQTPHGARDVIGTTGALTRLQTLRAWPFASVGAAFRARLQEVAHRYDFRVTSLVVLHAIGDAPQIRVQSDTPKKLIENLPAIDQALRAPQTPNCWTSGSCFNGWYFEGDDAAGQPFLQTTQVLLGPDGTNGGYGGQWVRRGLPYPYPHGGVVGKAP